MFRTSDHCFLFLTCFTLKTWFELLRVKIFRLSEGKHKLLQVSRRFELSRVKLQLMYEGNPREIDFGSSYREVRVSARFELARVRVLGSPVTYQNCTRLLIFSFLNLKIFLN